MSAGGARRDGPVNGQGSSHGNLIPMEVKNKNDEAEDESILKPAKESKSMPYFPLFIVVEFIMILFFGVGVGYDTETDSTRFDANTTDVVAEGQRLQEIYPSYQDVHVMVFIGFGFLMTFLRRHGYSAVGLTFMVACLSVQWAILMRGFFHNCFTKEWHKIPINVEALINADFAAAAVLISFGGIIGKLRPNQLLVMALFEIIFYSINEQILVERLQVLDVGGSMIIHMFGAFFGLAVTWVLAEPVKHEDPNEASVYHSDLFSMIGTIFLFLFWPSFNGALAGDAGNSRQRAIINTLLAITSSTLTAFFLSPLLRKKKFNMVDIQNATLSGGVAMGAAANFRTYPWGAMVVGVIAGAVSTWGFAWLQPRIKHRLRDACGILNLHGMPGVVGGFASVFFAGIATRASYGDYYETFFASHLTDQALYQFWGIGVTFGMAVSSGLLTGLFLKLMGSGVKYEFDDALFWDVPGDEIPYFYDENKPRENAV